MRGVAGKKEETDQHGWKMHPQAPQGGEEGLRESAWDMKGDRGGTDTRMRHQKGTFSSDENNFLPTSPN